MSYFGAALAMSSDSSVLVVGAPKEAADDGAVYVYPDFEERTALQLPPALSAASFGRDVTITSDGTEIFVTAPGTTNGRVFAYKKQNRVWIPDGEIIPTSPATPYNLTNTAASSNGKTLLIGTDVIRSPAMPWIGGHWVFTRSGNKWIQETPQMVVGDYTGNSQQGYSVDVSAAGDIAIVGGIGDNNRGAIWIFI